MRTWITLCEAFSDFNAEMITLPKGSSLFHGTDTTGFQIPRGPAWFVENKTKAREWAGWANYDPHTKYVMKFATNQDLQLIDLDAVDDWVVFCKTITGIEDELPPKLVALELMGKCAGWYSVDEIMLTEPEKCLIPK